MVGLTAGWGNVGYMGLPLLLTAYGPDGALPTIVSLLSVIIFFVGSPSPFWRAHAFRVIAPSCGLAFGRYAIARPVGDLATARHPFFDDRIPSSQSGQQLSRFDGAAVAPAALFAMGLSLVGHKLIGNVGEVIWLAALKTVVNPILTFALVTYVFTMEPLWTQAAVILSAMPTATNTYVIAQQYNVYFKTVSPAVVISNT